MKTALILLDFINAITQSERFKPYLTKHHIIANTNRLVRHARKEKDLIIFVKVGFSDLYPELPHRSHFFAPYKSNQRLKLNTPDTDLDAELDYRPGDLVIVKHRVNAFYSTALEAILNANDIDHLILCGISTNFA